MARPPNRAILESMFRRAVQAFNSANFAAAAKECERMLAQDKTCPPALQMLGAIGMQTGNFTKAASYFAKVAKTQPSSFEARANLGLAQLSLGLADKAVSEFEAALRLAPNMADIHNHLANALAAAGRDGEAVERYAAAIRLNPNFPELRVNLATHHLAMGRLAEAEADFRALFPRAPNHPRIRAGLSRILVFHGKAMFEADTLDGAAAALIEAVNLDDSNAEAHLFLGQTMLAAGKNSVAIAAFRNAARSCAEAVPLLFETGNALCAVKLWDEAAALFDQVEHLAPSHVGALVSLGSSHLQMGRHSQAAAAYERALKVEAANETALRACLNAAMYRDDIDAVEIQRLHTRYGQAHAETLSPLQIPAREDGRLRIGYLSSDFHDHPVTGNMLPVLRNHDRRAFSIHLYANVASPDRVTAKVKDMADSWCDTTGMSDRETAERIRADGIHILVSLAGHFDQNRPGVCGYRAAPVQISMHDVATSGLSEMDYVVGDAWLLPRHAPEAFSERALRLPQFYLADIPEELPPLNTPPPRQGPVVFSCFNSPAKITPTILGLWGRILSKVPDSVLLLKYANAYESDELRQRMTDTLVQAGADGGSRWRAGALHHRAR
ncbi:putative TPR repeat-containing protein [Candidatus Terasakiella magnetica]|nr:putative TPR repeat-containing protein [Candidatus Terasakiella magnetica]